MAMTLSPTDDQLKTLQSVAQSIAGIDAVRNMEAGFDCVIYGWLEHRAHRRDDGGLIDVWRLTEEGRRVLKNPPSKLHDHPACHKKSTNHDDLGGTAAGMKDS
jgi:hypothetical protein